MTLPPVLLREETAVLAESQASLRAAAEALKAGKLVVFPTETVYGLGANARDDVAVASIFAVKERPRFNPLIVHVADKDEAARLVRFNPQAEKLAAAFWPGGLTLVLPRRERCPLSLLVGAGLDTAAVRVPAHPSARALIEMAGVPIAAPSANRSGGVSPTTAAAAAEELFGRVPIILDGGPCPIGLESTVVGFDDERPLLLRPGAVPRDAIAEIVGPLGTAGSGIMSPGMMASHYAPRAALRLDAADIRAGEALLAFGRPVPRGALMTCNLSDRGDLTEAAANLFAMLRELDRSGAATIAVMKVPDYGLGEAINDRLRRAAAPRGR